MGHERFDVKLYLYRDDARLYETKIGEFGEEIWEGTGYNGVMLVCGDLRNDIDHEIVAYRQKLTDALLSEGIFKAMLHDRNVLGAIHHIPEKIHPKDKTMLKEFAVIINLMGDQSIEMLLDEICNGILNRLSDKS